MDAVILAAGRGERLRDLTPAFHKPLLPIDGVPLVCRAVDLASDVAERVVVVAAPANAEALVGALGRTRDNFVIIQPEPVGPGNALWYGLQLCTAERVMVLLSDNVVSALDVEKVTKISDTAVGIKYMPRTEATRFTRFENGSWVERKPLSPYGGEVACWIGPFVGIRQKMLDKLWSVTQSTDNDEVLIGPYLADFMSENFMMIPVDSYDVGTLASYPAGGKIK